VPALTEPVSVPLITIYARIVASTSLPTHSTAANVIENAEKVLSAQMAPASVPRD
jgi:hypothetical protein